VQDSVQQNKLFLWYRSSQWDKTTSLDCGLQRAYCLSPSWYMSMEDHSEIMQTRKNSWLVHQSALWQSYQQSHLVANRKDVCEGNDGFFTKSFFHTTKGYLACRKILRLGAFGFTSATKEGVLWICIALKNPSPRPGLKSRCLGPIASTLIITPSTREGYYCKCNQRL
jgi:hypothetical protein